MKNNVRHTCRQPPPREKQSRDQSCDFSREKSREYLINHVRSRKKNNVIFWRKKMFSKNWKNFFLIRGFDFWHGSTGSCMAPWTEHYLYMLVWEIFLSRERFALPERKTFLRLLSRCKKAALSTAFLAPWLLYN